MPGISTDIVIHRLPTDPNFLLVKQKPLPKKSGEVRVCVDYRDLNKASPKEDFSLPNIHILLDNTAGHEIESFGDCFVGYYQILMAEEDREKTSFITPWGIFCYRVMPFGLKNVGATYQRTITILFHDMIHKEMEAYVDDIIIKSRKVEDHLVDLKKLFERLRKYNLKLNPAKYAFGAPAVSPQPGRPLIMYLSVLDEAVGCVLGQHDESGRKEQAIYYLSKKFTAYEAYYSFLERSCCALAWAAQKLRHYLLGYTTYLISCSDPLKYLLEKSMPTRRMIKWQMILSEFDFVFTTQKAINGQVIVDHLAENPRDDDYQPLHTYFPDEEILFVGAVENMSKQYLGWRLFFDGAANSFGAGIGAVLVSPEGKHYFATAKLQFPYTNNMAEYEACIFGLKMALDMEIKDLIAFSDSDLLAHQTLKQWVTRDSKIMLYHCNLLSLASKFRNLELRHIPRTRNAFVDALATLSSMIQHPDELVIEPIQIQL
nr:uncharacterized protein LOC113739111 [Coffea arabica]